MHAQAPSVTSPPPLHMHTPLSYSPAHPPTPGHHLPHHLPHLRRPVGRGFPLPTPPRPRGVLVPPPDADRGLDAQMLRLGDQRPRLALVCPLCLHGSERAADCALPQE